MELLARTVWDNVDKLNNQILASRHNISYTYICKSGSIEEKTEWILKYSRACLHELSELLEKPSGENAKIEIIDILFFTTALFQLFNISLKTFITCLSQSVDFVENVQHLYAEAWLATFTDVENCVPWKHWASYQEYDPNAASIALYNFIGFWLYHVKRLDLSEETLVNIFKQKLQVNFNRQTSGYKTKTEKDNEAIKIKS